MWHLWEDGLNVSYLTPRVLTLRLTQLEVAVGNNIPGYDHQSVPRYFPAAPMAQKQTSPDKLFTKRAGTYKLLVPTQN